MENYSNILFHHRQPAQLRFSDVDQFGHVNNSIYFSLFDMCKTQYFRDIFGKNVFDTKAIFVVNIDANFIAPIYYPDEIAIETAIVRLGNKSFTVLQRALNGRTNDVKCECKTTMVLFDKNANHSIPLTCEAKQKIADFEKNVSLLQGTNIKS